MNSKKIFLIRLEFILCFDIREIISLVIFLLFIS